MVAYESLVEAIVQTFCGVYSPIRLSVTHVGLFIPFFGVDGLVEDMIDKRCFGKLAPVAVTG